MEVAGAKEFSKKQHDHILQLTMKKHSVAIGCTIVRQTHIAMWRKSCQKPSTCFTFTVQESEVINLQLDHGVYFTMGMDQHVFNTILMNIWTSGYVNKGGFHGIWLTAIWRLSAKTVNRDVDKDAPAIFEPSGQRSRFQLARLPQHIQTTEQEIAKHRTEKGMHWSQSNSNQIMLDPRTTAENLALRSMKPKLSVHIQNDAWEWNNFGYA